MPIRVQVQGRDDIKMEFPDDTPQDVVQRMVEEQLAIDTPAAKPAAQQGVGGQRQTTQVAATPTSTPTPVQQPLPSLRDVLDRSKPLPKSLEDKPSVLFGTQEKPTFLRSIFSQPLTPDNNKPLPTMEELNARAKHDQAVPPMWKVGSGIDKDNVSPSAVLDQGLQFENLGVSKALRDVTDKAGEYPFLQNVGKAITGIAAGVEDLATGLTTPNNMALMGGAAGLAKVAPKAARGLSGLFALDMAGGFVDSAKQLAQAMEAGDVEGMARAGVHGAGSAVFGTGALRHLAGKPVITPKVKPPEVKPTETVPTVPTPEITTSTTTTKPVEPVKPTRLTPPQPPPEAALVEEVATPKVVPEVKVPKVEAKPVPTDVDTVDTYIDKVAEPYKRHLEDIPKDPSPNPSNDVYLGSGFGSLQSLFTNAFNGRLSNGVGKTLGRVSNAIRRTPSKIQETADTIVEQAADHTLAVRQMDEAAGLRMNNPEDLNRSAWVAFGMQPGSIGSALGWAHDVVRFVKKQNKELWKENKKVITNRRASGQDTRSRWSPSTWKQDREANRQMLDKSKEWTQLVSLEKDIPELYKDGEYDYPSFPDSPPDMVGTLADVIRRRQVIEQEVGPEMVSVFDRQSKELLTEYRKILHSILVKPYFDMDANGKPLEGVGLMSQEQFDAMTAKRAFYAPLQRNLDTIENSTYSTGGRMSVPENTATKKLKQGSKAPLKPLVPSMINELTRSIILANKNHAARKLAAVGTPTGLVKQVKPGYTPGKINGVPAEVVFNVVENGVRRTYMTSPELRIAIDRLDKHQFDTLTEALSSANDLYRTGITMNPRFMVNNVGRDLGTSFITDPNPHGIFAIRYVHGMLKGLSKEVDFLKTNEDYIDFLKYFGGGSGVKEYLTGATSQKGIDRLTQEFNPTIPQQVNPKKLWRAYQHVGEGLEIGPRLMAARNSKLAGENKYLQSVRGRNITVDFAKHGAAAWAATAKKALPFVNARLQGTRNMMNVVGESLKETPIPGLKAALNKMGVAPTRSTKAQRQHVATGFGTLATFAISAFVWNTAAFPELYDQVSDYVKEGSLFWLTGEKDEKGQPKTHGLNIPIQDVAWFVELINGSLSYLVNKHPEQYRALVKKFYPKLEMPEEIVKFDFKKRAANAIGSLLPITVTKGGELSTEEIIKSLQIPLVSAAITAGTGYDVRHNKAADMGMPGERRQRYDQYTSPSALLMSRGLNTAMDATGIFNENTPLRSAPVLQAAGEQLAGPLWFRAGDSVIREINKRVTPTNALSPAIPDPQTEMGGGKEKPGLWESAFTDNFKRARIGADSEEVRKRQMYQALAGNTSSDVNKEARKLYTDIKKGDGDKARLRLAEAKSKFTNKDDQDAFAAKVADLLTMDETNAAIKQYNTTAKYKIPDMTEADARFSRADVDARAMYVLDGIQSRTTPEARKKFLVEMQVKKITNPRVYGALRKLIEQQATTTTTTTTTPTP